MARSFPKQRQHQPQWYVPNLLPQGELVLLDGDPKVGKTLITAGLGAFLELFTEMHHPGSILFANTAEQQENLVDYLLNQRDDLDHFRHVDLEELSQEGHVLETLIPFLEHELKQNNTRFLFLDGLEQFIISRLDEESPPPSITAYLVFWRQLRELAVVNNCTILVTRTDGLHQSRAYGSFTKAGSRIAPIIFTLHWHPSDPARRLLTLVHNQRGYPGNQFQAHITPDGLVRLVEAESHHVLKPPKSLAPWKPDPMLADPNRKVYKQIEAALDGQPVTELNLETLVGKYLSSPARLANALSHMKLPTLARHGTVVYFPNTAMLERHQDKQETNKTPENQPNAARTTPKPTATPTPTQNLSLTQKPATAAPLGMAG
jgi:hypothetical protein